MSAVISVCGQYRYRLERDIAMEGPVYAFIGVNPSKADATLNDTTVSKLIGFVKRWGGSRFIVGNVFAFRATDVRDVAVASDPIGPENYLYLQRMIEDADILVPCWGSIAKVPDRLRGDFSIVRRFMYGPLDLVNTARKPIKTFGFTKSGDPKHPLMLGYDTPLIDWATPQEGKP